MLNILLDYRNLDHLLNVRGGQVSMIIVDVPGEAGQGVQSLPTQPAGEGVWLQGGV